MPPLKRTLTINGVPFDFVQADVEAQTINQGPVALSRKHCVNVANRSTCQVHLT